MTNWELVPARLANFRVCLVKAKLGRVDCVETLGELRTSQVDFWVAVAVFLLGQNLAMCPHCLQM